ncbi:hypothetical protein Dsin_010732 [Dipteronia sinensis]|uniref:HMA domain-containing protein n=1 Tax=Dipteronia sinensis TaxID=43782 RepID=A0AAE0AU97_9ROSI|nr:hypothetical protein Dsin_010732 [Dipteronia sinensis]
MEGVFDPPKLAEIITKRWGKHVEIVKEEAIKEREKDREECDCVLDSQHHFHSNPFRRRKKMGKKNGINKQTTSQNQGDEDQKVENCKEIILKVYMHCEGCSNKVFDCLRGFDGVEEIKMDRANNTVIVKGEKADPIKVFERVQKKYSRNVELLHPKPAGEKKQEPEKKEPEPIVKIVILKMYMHCEGCVRDIKKNIVRMEGVFSVEPDMGNSQVTVKGVFDPPKLVEIITKRLGKHVEIVKEEQVEKERNIEFQGDTEEKCVVYNPPPHLQNVCDCLIFSDENINSCSIM